MSTAWTPALRSPPASELRRTLAAQRVGALAASSGLFFSHFEHRRFLPWPEAWEPVGRPDLGVVEGWRDGTLPETKFLHFQLDRRIGSFHPGQQPRWTAHELCHGLVGFAWAPGRSRFWHAQAARLAELLPVALWYFFDQAGAFRCPVHADAGALFEQLCPACEAGAAQGPVEDARGESLRAQGRAFVEAELAALLRSRRLGSPLSTRFGSIDLMSDALASVAAHGARLQSPTFADWVERFAPVGAGRLDSLEALEARVLALLAHLDGEAEAAPWAASPATWAIQDLGWRLMMVAADTEGEPQRGLLDLADALSAAPPGEEALTALIAGYRALCEEWELPAPQDLFAVGYPLPGGLGSDLDQLKDGVHSALPHCARHTKKELPARVAAFAEADGLLRQPIGRRFAAWMAETAPGPLAELAALEAAVTHARPPNPAEASLIELPVPPGQPCRLGSSLERLRLSIDPQRALAGAAPRARKAQTAVAVVRRGLGVDALALSPEAAAALDRLPDDPQALDALDPADRDELVSLGIVAPCRFDEASTPSRAEA
jgi:hypothetical protein